MVIKTGSDETPDFLAVANNDTWPTGYLLPTASNSTPGLVSCPSDNDFFLVDLDVGDTISVDATFTHADGNLGLLLRDPSLNIVASGQSITDNESVGPYTATSAGEHQIFLYLVSESDGVPGNDYDLDVTVTTASGCSDDAFEDNDSWPTGYLLSSSSSSTPDLVACPGDNDFFLIDLELGDTITVDATFTHADGNIGLLVRDPSLNIVASGQSVTDNETAGPYVATATGEHQIFLYLVSETDGVPGNDYDLDVDVVPAGPAVCVDDVLEENDDPTINPTVITPPDAYSLQACDGDSDYFVITLAAGEALVVDAIFSHAEGDIDLELFDDLLVLVDDSVSVTDDENITYTAATSGDHFLHVANVNDLGSVPGNPYDIGFAIVVAAVCAPDALEEDDDPVSSPTVVTPPDSFIDLTSCDLDDDWFEVTTSGAEILEIDATFSHAEGDIDLFLFDLAANEVDSAESSTDDESMAYPAPGADTYFLQVTLFNDTGPLAGNSYSIDFDTSPPVTCIDDAYEDNDTDATPAAVSAGNYPALAACPSDDDYYSFTASAGEDISALTTFSHAEGDIDMELFDSAGNLLDDSFSLTDNEGVSFVAPANDTYIVRVELFTDSGSILGNPYSMDVFVGAPPSCPDDVLEDNDDAGSATPLTVPDSLSLYSCDLDDDFFELTLAAGEDLTVDAVFDHSDGDIDIYLYDLSALEVASSLSTTDDESVTYSVTTSATYFLLVTLAAEGPPNTGNAYDLSLSGTLSTCTDDAFEENDSEAAAVPITTGLTSGLQACPVDVDFYSFAVVAGEIIDIDVFFSHADGNVDAELLDPAGDPIVEAFSTTDNETIAHTASSTGTYLLGVELYTDAGPTPGNSYSVDLSIN